MAWKVKNWKQFQHFKDRRPPWIKLYRDILDDPEWHELDPEAAKALVMLWLIASESDGNLPDIKKISFRLRKSEKMTSLIISQLSHWINQEDINAISDRYQVDAPETEGETEKRKNPPTPQGGGFEKFWQAYPKKKSKGQAEKAFRALRPDEHLLAKILQGLERAKKSVDWQKDGGQFIPHPATWLRARGWEDEYGIETAKPRPETCHCGRPWVVKRDGKPLCQDHVESTQPVQNSPPAKGSMQTLGNVFGAMK